MFTGGSPPAHRAASRLDPIFTDRYYGTRTGAIAMAPKKIEALLLDLDGTLLDIDFRSFMNEYVATLAAKFADVIPVDVFGRQLFESTRAMIFNAEPNRTTLEAFLEDFTAHVPLPDDAMRPLQRLLRDRVPTPGTLGEPCPRQPRTRRGGF